MAEAGSVSLLVINIENDTMNDVHGIIIACNARRNIALFEASQPPSRQWIQDGGGLRALQKIAQQQYVGNDVEQAQYFQQAREHCNVAAECLWRMPYHRNKMQEMQFAPPNATSSARQGYLQDFRFLFF